MNLPECRILGCKLNMLSMEETLREIKYLIEKKIPSQVITLNAEIAYQASRNTILREIINSAALVTPDGIGIVWGARKLGYKVEERVTGIDLMYNLCREAANNQWKVYLLGAAPGIAEKASQELLISHPGLTICGSKDGYFNEQEIPEIIEKIREQEPDILFAALGVPKQELWISKYKNIIKVPVCIGVGGSFDVVAGLKKRAPLLMRKMHLEWFYRLLKEPLRIKRQWVLPAFVIKIWGEKYRAGK